MSIRAARARHDESLIIIIHKTLRWESARRETKQERCAAKQERVPSLPRGLAYVLLIPGGEPEYSTAGRGCARVSRAETQSLPASAPIRAPRRWRRLTYALPLRIPLARPVFSLSRSSYTTVPSCLFLSHTVLNSPTLLVLDQHRNRPQIYCLESAHMEASSTRLMTYQGCRLPDFSDFARSSLELVAVHFF